MKKIDVRGHKKVEIENLRREQKLKKEHINKINGFSFYEIMFFLIIILISLACKMLEIV